MALCQNLGGPCPNWGRWTEIPMMIVDGGNPIQALPHETMAVWIKAKRHCQFPLLSAPWPSSPTVGGQLAFNCMGLTFFNTNEPPCSWICLHPHLLPTDRYCTMQPDSDKCDSKREMSRAMEIASALIYKETALRRDGERKTTASNSFEKYCF